MTAVIHNSLVRWGLLASMVCVGLATWTGYAAGHDMFDSLAHCIFTVPAIALVCGVSWLTHRIVWANRT